MNITVRKGHEGDTQAIFLLIKEFAIFQKSVEKVSITPEQMIAEQNLFKCFVAETADKKVIGFASFFFAYYSWTGKAIYLDDLYVQELYRGHQVGSLLLSEIINLAKKENCRKVRWQVSKWNVNGIDFYKKMGALLNDVEINCDLEL